MLTTLILVVLGTFSSLFSKNLFLLYFTNLRFTLPTKQKRYTTLSKHKKKLDNYELYYMYCNKVWPMNLVFSLVF